MALPNRPNPSGGGVPPRLPNPQPPAPRPAFDAPGLPDLGEETFVRPRPAAAEPAPDLSMPEISPPEPSHVTQYDFKAQSAAAEQRAQEDDAFTSLTPEELLQEEEREETALARPRREREERRPAPANLGGLASRTAERPRSERFSEDELTEEVIQEKREHIAATENNRRTKKDKKGQPLFVDEKAKKVKPLGGSRSKLKVEDLDRRANMRRKSQVIQYVALGLILLVLGFSLKNAFFPPPTLSQDDVVATINETVERTNFPLAEGEGFVEDFMQAFLTVNNDSISQAALGYFYTGTLTPGSGESPNRANTSQYNQSLLFGPTIYGATYLTDSSANYTVGALVQPAPVEGEQPPVDGSTARWEFFSINVYYDAATDRFAITEDSPTLIPTPDLMPVSDVPTAAVLGNGETDEELNSAVRSTVLGFMEGYRVSSPANHTAIDQYLAANAGPDLLTGLNGVYDFAGSAEQAVQWTAFRTTGSSELKVSVQATWRSIVGDESARNDYISHYVMTLIPTSEGAYAVSRFAPEYYVAEEE